MRWRARVLQKQIEFTVRRNIELGEKWFYSVFGNFHDPAKLGLLNFIFYETILTLLDQTPKFKQFRAFFSTFTVKPLTLLRLIRVFVLLILIYYSSNAFVWKIIEPDFFPSKFKSKQVLVWPRKENLRLSFTWKPTNLEFQWRFEILILGETIISKKTNYRSTVGRSN